MQAVKHRKPRKSHRQLWICLALCAALLGTGAAIWQSRRTEEETPHRNRTDGELINRNPEEILEITIRPRGKKTWSLHRGADGEMHLNGKNGPAADPLTVDQMLDALAHLRYEDILTDDVSGLSMENFGLEDPKITEECRFADGETVRIRLGNPTETEDGAWSYLQLEGDSRLYAVSAGTAADLSMEQSMLTAVEQLDLIESLIDRITVYGPDGTVTAEWELQGAVTDQDAGMSWTVQTPYRYPADEEIVQNLKKCAAKLRLGSRIADAEPEEMKSRGLDEHGHRLIIHSAAGTTGTVGTDGVYDLTDHPEKTVTLMIGEAHSDMMDIVSDGQNICTVSHFLLSPLTETDPAETLARYIAPVSLNSLESMTVRNAEGTDEWVLIRSGTEKGEPVLCMKNGETFSYAAFAAAYERLLAVTVSGRLPKGADWGEPYAEYVFCSVSGKTYKVDLSPYDAMHDAVIMNGETLFYLIRGGMPDMP